AWPSWREDVSELDAAGEEPRGIAVAEILGPPLLADPGGAADAPVAVVGRIEARHHEPGRGLPRPHPEPAQMGPQASREAHTPPAAGLGNADRAAAGAGGPDHQPPLGIVHIGAPLDAGPIESRGLAQSQGLLREPDPGSRRRRTLLPLGTPDLHRARLALDLRVPPLGQVRAANLVDGSRP